MELTMDFLAHAGNQREAERQISQWGISFTTDGTRLSFGELNEANMQALIVAALTGPVQITVY